MIIRNFANFYPTATTKIHFSDWLGKAFKIPAYEKIDFRSKISSRFLERLPLKTAVFRFWRPEQFVAFLQR